ncbi:NADP-dependent 3-hydroxy acid dehydrogenase YdfG [Halovenus aranensis]|uniref:NADP-dependent 3-hydroxy acid dehydrogenase YdfG n=1 Tax=Halovenus aranensis TaxID=890420 RepID=A0A1G8YBD6_9EURY|nr:SDR family NAD(P)-dependent oxidoreductase [Halovenus aranensis]SDJ99983.1 NADP-dependent 3-hydroxy acid dehydrogenase YdfG [Halovenus aranensis]
MSDTVLIADVGETIGEATARHLHDAGYGVGLFARSAPLIEGLAADLGAGAVAIPTDITDTAAVEAGVERLREELGQLDAVILNATAGGGRPVEDASVERLRSMFDVRVAGSLACVQAALPDLRETDGTVVFSGTTYAEKTAPEQVEWGAVAPATQGLAATLDAALAQVQVTYVSIGTSVTPAGTDTQRSLEADELARLYQQLIERDRAVTRSMDVLLRE